MEEIKRLDIPLLGDGEYTEWVFNMVENIQLNQGHPEVKLDVIIKNLIRALVEMDDEYHQVYDIFFNKNYIDVDNRNDMEEGLGKFEGKLGRFMLTLVHLMQYLDITPFMLEQYYKDFIKEQNLNVLQGAHEIFNLSLQVGHYENYIISEVGWSLRGAFNIVPPADMQVNSNRAFIGNRISNDSVYVMKIKQWDIISAIMKLYGTNSVATSNTAGVNLWGYVFNYLNYLDVKPLRLFNIIQGQYTSIINLMERNADNK